MNCAHVTTATGRERCFSGPVYTPPYTEENRAAHGCVAYTETCDGCGAERFWNCNGAHMERSAWGLSAAEREARAWDDAAVALRIDDEEIRVAGTAPTGHVEMLIGGRRKYRRDWLSQYDLAAACAQDDAIGRAMYQQIRRAAWTP